MSAEMPAAVIRQYAAAPEYALFPIPSRGPGQVLVRVTAAPISPLDLLCASGTSYFGPPRLPYIPGVQGIGIVMEAEILAPGQRVWFSCDAGMKPGDGSMALYCVIDESSAFVLTGQIDDDLAAALRLSAIAAWMALTWRRHLQPGEQVLVLGASGAVGQVAMQAAKLLGAGRVIAASRDEEARGRALSRGADAVVDLTSDDVEDMSRRIAAACDGPLHLVIDPVWGLPAEAAVRVLAAAWSREKRCRLHESQRPGSAKRRVPVASSSLFLDEEWQRWSMASVSCPPAQIAYRPVKCGLRFS